MSKWRKIRLTLFDRIRSKICNEGEFLPWYGILLRWLILPLDTANYVLNKSMQIYDPYRDVYNINGLKVSGGFFKSFNLSKIGERFEVIAVHDGVKTLKRLTGES